MSLMRLVDYAPSARFTTITLSLLLSAGLVFTADYATHPQTTTGTLTTNNTTSASEDWEAALFEIQANNASTALGKPDPDTLIQMLAAAQDPNLTNTVGKTLLVNLSNAKFQGLGNDIPTQDQILSAATAQVSPSKASLYTSAQLTIVESSNASLKAYGNGVIQALNHHPAASERDTLVAVDSAITKNSPAELKKLDSIGAEYRAIAEELIQVPVPKTLYPLHLTIINNYSVIATSYTDMEASLSDPLRGIVGLQTYENKMDELSRVFINIAQSLNKDGILFTNDEPGVAWKSFLSSP